MWRAISFSTGNLLSSPLLLAFQLTQVLLKGRRSTIVWYFEVDQWFLIYCSVFLRVVMLFYLYSREFLYLLRFQSKTWWFHNLYLFPSVWAPFLSHKVAATACILWPYLPSNLYQLQIAAATPPFWDRFFCSRRHFILLQVAGSNTQTECD